MEAPLQVGPEDPSGLPQLSEEYEMALMSRQPPRSAQLRRKARRKNKDARTARRKNR